MAKYCNLRFKESSCIYLNYLFITGMSGWELTMLYLPVEILRII
jgi:hypothetical protein